MAFILPLLSSWQLRNGLRRSRFQQTANLILKKALNFKASFIIEINNKQLKKLTMENGKNLSSEQQEKLIKELKIRFEKNMNLHADLKWIEVQEKLEANSEKLWSLNEMEKTGGEPDVVEYDRKTDEYIF